MTINDRIIIKNYKCFGDGENGFEKIMPINIIIGKNNAGKSSLIDLVKFLMIGDRDFFENNKSNLSVEILIESTLSSNHLTGFDRYASRSGIPETNNFLYGQRFVGAKYTYKLNADYSKKFVSIDMDYVEAARELIEGIADRINFAFVGKKFCQITAERDIVPESSNNATMFDPNGRGSTDTIREILNKRTFDSRIVEVELLNEMNRIINPDISFTRILVQEDSVSKWEIFFEDAQRKRIALSKMGSGVKTILLVLLNLIVRPKIENQSEASYVFGFEELENNLHPALQRRLYRYILEYSKKHSSYFFITTHSNVVIDTFIKDENAQIVYVRNDSEGSTTNTLSESNHLVSLINDLGVKASDLLQCNGVIWVEGPSDRIYINKWISLMAPNLTEGVDYCIMYYGGRLLSNLTFDFDWFNSNIIPLLRINKNSFVIMDRDGKDKNAKINETKSRIREEIGDENCWITEGKEIENYITEDIIVEWLNAKGIKLSGFNNDCNSKIEDNIAKSISKDEFKYNTNKMIYSTEIASYFTEESINKYDLKEKMLKLTSTIKKWNSV